METDSASVGTVNKAYLLKRGWTRTSIKRILGEPDRRILLRQFRKDRPECRYSLERVLAAEEAGFIRYRAAGDRCIPGMNVPETVAEAMASAPTARERRRILRRWAEREGMICTTSPAPYRKRALAKILEIFTIQKEIS